MLCAPSILWPERERDTETQRHRDTERQRQKQRQRERERDGFDRGEGLLGRNFDAILCN